MLGVIVNAAAVIFGSLLGLLFKKGIPKKVSDAIMTGLGLCILYIGISTSLDGKNILVAIGAMILGAICGTLLNIDGGINKLGEKIGEKFKSNSGSVGQGFVTASLLFCVGSMSVVGSLNSGISGDHSIIFTKSLLDMIAASMFSATLGAGVILSFLSVIVFQGSIVLLAQLVAPFLSDAAIAEMNCVGGLMILALGLNMIGVTKIKVANYLPAILFAVLIANIVAYFS